MGVKKLSVQCNASLSDLQDLTGKYRGTDRLTRVLCNAIHGGVLGEADGPNHLRGWPLISMLSQLTDQSTEWLPVFDSIVEGTALDTMVQILAMSRLIEPDLIFLGAVRLAKIEDLGRGFCLNWTSRRLEHNGEEVHLRPKELDCLMRLFADRGRVISRGELFSAIWTGACPSYVKTVDVTICSLKKALGGVEKEGEEHWLIKTIRGSGWLIESPAQN